MHDRTLDRLTIRFTAFDSFDSLVNALGGYFPSLQTSKSPDLTVLADSYDEFQQRRGDLRRACRS